MKKDKNRLQFFLPTEFEMAMIVLLRFPVKIKAGSWLERLC